MKLYILAFFLFQLSQNPLSPAGVLALLSAIKANPESKLKVLDVSVISVY